MSLLIGPRPLAGHQYANAVARASLGAYVGASAMSPDHAWCSHSRPLGELLVLVGVELEVRCLDQLDQRVLGGVEVPRATRC